ncbi:hypothetical protein GIB67_041478 [Kingdonia uniflora]|uniref:Uncharacterized protein n=1 Tax=Kingdonia uniflora TaxID=39325 RepID=A0A7J7LRK6_9MAGN|nr:hypothetical protein GIB67_041478 [Kingdonia uniflora]
MNGVQLNTIVHFGGDIVRLKIGSIDTYVGGSTKLISLRTYSSYNFFVILLEETSKICREDCKLYNFVNGCACAISPVQDFTVMINMHKTNPGTPFHLWIVNDLRVLSQNSQNFISDFCSSGKRGLDPRRFGPFADDENDSFKTIRTDVPPSNEPSIPQSNVYLSNEPVLTNVPQSNKPFQTIPTNVPLSNESYIPQSSIHLANEPMLTNVHPSNKPMLTNVPLSIESKPIIGQTETSAEFWLEPQPE